MSEEENQATLEAVWVKDQRMWNIVDSYVGKSMASVEFFGYTEIDLRSK